MTRKRDYIDYSEDHNPMVRLEIDGDCYGFSVSSVHKDSHDWLLHVLKRQMQEIHDKATMKAINEIRKDFKNILGI